MQTNSPERLYNIQNSTYYYTGFRENGNQVLMGIQMPEIVIVEFDAAGNYLGLTAKTSVNDSQSLPQSPHTLIYGILPPELIQWQTEIAFTPATISVKKFFLEEQWIGIQDLPQHYQDFLENPDGSEFDEPEEYEKEIQQWKEQGDFVLWWGEDYYLDRDGDVTSS